MAEEYLRRHHLKTVARHFSTPTGELDLVMRDGDTVVFVEVKTRRDRKYADPEDSVNRAKRSRMARAARWFIHLRRWEDRPCRFDVVTVILAEGAEPEIVHFPDCFTPRNR